MALLLSFIYWGNPNVFCSHSREGRPYQSRGDAVDPDSLKIFLKIKYLQTGSIFTCGANSALSTLVRPSMAVLLTEYGPMV